MRFQEEQRRQLKATAQDMMARRSANKDSRIPEDHRKQLKAVADNMMSKRRMKESKSGSATSQRARLKSVAKKMNTQSTNKGDTNRREEMSRRKNLRLSQSSTRRISLSGALESLPFCASSPVDLDDTSVSNSTYTTLENSLNNSYNGSLEVSSRSLLSCNVSGNGSSLSRGLGNSQDELDCSYFLIISNIWETVKRIDGYHEDLAEYIICNMMALADCPQDVRRDLKLKSFRSARFMSLARILIDAVDVLVTLIGPDLDTDELLEIGEKLQCQGVSCKLFGQAMALALRDLLGEKEFPADDFNAWHTAFELVARKMEG